MLPPEVPLGYLAVVRPSSVDKAVIEHEQPVRLCNYTDVYYGDRVTGEEALMAGSATPEEIFRFRLRRDDVLITKDSESPDDIAVPAWVARDLPDVVLGYHTTLVRPTTDLDGRYLYWTLQAEPLRAYFYQHARGVTRYALRQQDVTAASIPRPTLEEQRRIADYLDDQTSRIDAALARNRQERELLHERQQAARTHLVGDAGLLRLDRNAVGHLRWFDCEVQTGPFGSQLHADDYVTDGHPVVNPSNIVDGALVANDEARVDDAARKRLHRHVLRQGDVVFGRRGEMGRAAVVGPEEDGWLCGTGCLRVRFRRRRFRSDYLFEVLQSHGVRAWFDLMAVGSTMANLNEDLLGSLPVPVVPLDEQNRIMERIAEIRDEHQRLLWLLEHQERLLVERRQTLITAVVTGELEV